MRWVSFHPDVLPGPPADYRRLLLAVGLIITGSLGEFGNI